MFQAQVKRPASFADVVVFDPETVEDKATFESPHNYPEGIPYVIVNGEVVIDAGEHTGALPGTVMHSGRDTETVSVPGGAGTSS